MNSQPHSLLMKLRERIQPKKYITQLTAFNAIDVFFKSYLT